MPILSTSRLSRPLSKAPPPASHMPLRTMSIAGDDLTDDIQEHMRRAHNIKVGERTAELIKMNVGSALTELENPPEDYIVHGPNQMTALPHKKLSDEELELIDVLKCHSCSACYGQQRVFGYVERYFLFLSSRHQRRSAATQCKP